MDLTSDYFKEEKKEVIIDCFKCGECGYSASSEDDLKQHRFNQHIFTAVFGFIEADNDEGDLKKLSSANNTQNKEGKDNELFAETVPKRIPKKFSCDECNFSSDRKQSYKNHVASVHKNIYRYGCNDCDYKSFHKHHVDSHL